MVTVKTEFAEFVNNTANQMIFRLPEYKQFKNKDLTNF
jgi:hypothetical protein